jgi:tetratricopeptide (TPR) repeat protein
MAHELGELEEAARQASACLPVRESSGDHAGCAEALNLLGAIATDRGEMDTAETHFAAALAHCAPNNHDQRGIIVHNSARLASKRGRKDEARILYEEALRHRRAAGDSRGEAETLGNLGVLAHLQDERDRARQYYLSALAIYRSQRSPYGTATMLNNLGELAEMDCELQTAVTLFIYAERIFRDLQSSDIQAPVDSLRRIAERAGPAQWPALRASAEELTWEEVVERIGSGSDGPTARDE